MSKTVLGILAHVDAGKTTLSESILYLTGSIRKLGRVDRCFSGYLQPGEGERHHYFLKAGRNCDAGKIVYTA